MLSMKNSNEELEKMFLDMKADPRLHSKEEGIETTNVLPWPALLKLEDKLCQRLPVHW
jgi:hypothetical protein